MHKLNLDDMKMLNVPNDRRWSTVLVKDNDGEMPNFYCIMPNRSNKKYDNIPFSQKLRKLMTPLCVMPFQTHKSKERKDGEWENNGVTDENLISILTHRLESLKQFKTPNKHLEWRVDKALMLIKELRMIHWGIYYENIMTRSDYENSKGKF